LDSALLDELRHRHAEPHRQHHTWQRVAGMVAEAEEIAHGIGDRPAFLLACCSTAPCLTGASPAMPRRPSR
jgi:hypothetical protein